MSKSVRGCFRIMKIQKYKHKRSIEARRNWWQFNDNGRARKGVIILIWNYIIFGKESTSNINIEKTAAVVAVAAVAALEAVNDGASCRSLHPITKWWFIVQTKDTTYTTWHDIHDIGSKIRNIVANTIIIQFLHPVESNPFQINFLYPRFPTVQLFYGSLERTVQTAQLRIKSDGCRFEIWLAILWGFYYAPIMIGSYFLF